MQRKRDREHQEILNELTHLALQNNAINRKLNRLLRDVSNLTELELVDLMLDLDEPHGSGTWTP